MEADFWHGKWARNEIGFHRSEANPLLVAHLDSLGLKPSARIFLPLCGKTLDIGWLLSNGFQVIGAELSEAAVVQLFAELEMTPSVTDIGGLKKFSVTRLDIFVGDIFSLDSETVGGVDAVYDRAALVALPHEMRMRYTAHLQKITSGAPQLLITFEYDQSVRPGPPFSIAPTEVHEHYGHSHDVSVLVEQEMAGGLKGNIPAIETAWRLQPK